MRKTLKQKRKEMGKTQSEIADILGISEVYVKALENGQCNPGIKTAIKFSRLYKSSHEELFPDIFLD